MNVAAWAAPPFESTQYGATRFDFLVNANHAFVILPTSRAADGTKPWVWYAPTFLGRHPDDSHTWMARQLLDAGFAIGGIEVGESYGSPAGVAVYEDFHQIVVSEYGLDVKACLLPQSRGGLMMLNWADDHAELVQCIAGIYTACNLESYPGLDRACGAYGMTEDELRADLGTYNPIERLESIATARIPMLFIHGDSDTVVPIERNAGELVSRVNALGGRAELITIPGKGHEVCPEFFESSVFMSFLLAKGEIVASLRSF